MDVYQNSWDNYDLNTEEGRVGFVRFRLNRMSDAKSPLDTKFQLSKQMYEVFEKHLTQGEQWNQAYRFPLVFGSIQRKYSDLIDNLPEVKIRATKTRSKDFTVAAQATYDSEEMKGNAFMEKCRTILSSLCYGTGILYEGYGQDRRKVMPVEDDATHVAYKKSALVETVLYDGLLSESIDIRDFYIDENAYVMHDDTGLMGAQDCARRRMYSELEWETKIKGQKPFKNTEKVKPVAWGVSMITSGKIPYDKESQEQKTSSKIYEVVEYWNKAKDMLEVVSNGVEIYFGANPYKHKKLPFIPYYNYRRDDSFWGVSEIEVIMPFVQAKEEITNLKLMDAKLKLQPALAVAGYAQFNEEENELQPGAIFNLRGVINGRVGDAIMPLSFGGIDPNSTAVLDSIENDQIAITGDDTRALYSNPGQLATQTLAKRDAAQKRIKSNILQNTLDSERHRAQIRFSNIVQFIARPYQSSTGKVSFRRIRLEGYEIRQDSDESKPYFKQKYGAQGYFTLNEKTFKNMDDSVEIEVIDTQLQEQLKDKEIDDMKGFLEVVLQFPEQMRGVNSLGLAKQYAKKLNIDYYEVFPDAEMLEGSDPVDVMIDLIIMGERPEYNGEIDPEKVDARLSDFKKTSMYKRLDKPNKIIFNDFQINVRSFIPAYLKRKLTALLRAQAESELPQTNAVPQPGAEGGMPSMAGAMLPGGIPTPAQGASPQPGLIPGAEGVQSRLGFGAR